MPNFQQIQALREHYGMQNPVDNKLSWEVIKFLNSHHNASLGKNIQERVRNLNEGFDKFRIQASLQPKDLDAIICLESQKKVNAVILFIDITDFSTKCKEWGAEKLSSYLDDYYDRVIPIIYKHGGEVEKIIGDGIICVFGEPFLQSFLRYMKSDLASKEIITTLKGSDKEVKIALHEGEIMYYKNKTKYYFEYTMIGKPLTELFRLEGVSENNAINYYVDSSLEYSTDKHVLSFDDLFGWASSSLKDVKDLKGVSFLYRKTKAKIK